MADRVGVIGRHLDTRHMIWRETTGVAGAVRTFRYTLDGGTLSDEQREQYEQNGFLVVKGIIPQTDLDTYAERFQQLCDGSIPADNMTLMRDVAIAKSEFKSGEGAVTKLQQFQDDEVLFEYMKHPEIIKVVRNFLGDDVMGVHTMLINKPPDQGTKSSRHPLHQDLQFFPFRPADRIVCAWTAMQHIDRHNGCLVVLPGSHRQDRLHEHGYPDWEGGVNKMYHGIMDYTPAEGDRTHLVMEAGDTVFFHPLLIHGSGMNRSEGFRKSISCHYAASDSYYVDVTNTSQEFIQSEIQDVIKRRLFGKDAHLSAEEETAFRDKFKLSDTWAQWARCVAGRKINL